MISAHDAVSIGDYPATASDSMLWWDVTGRMDVGGILADLGLHWVMDASKGELEAVVSRRQAKRIVALQELFLRAGVRPIRRGEKIDGPRAIYDLMQPIGRLTTEEFWVILLDARGRVLGRTSVARGGRNAVSVRAREVFHQATREPRCTLIVLVHNHPSGDPTPSQEDIALTHEMVRAGDLLGFTVHDHVVIGDGRFISMAELGHLEPTGPRRRGTVRGGGRAVDPRTEPWRA